MTSVIPVLAESPARSRLEVQFLPPRPFHPWVTSRWCSRNSGTGFVGGQLRAGDIPQDILASNPHLSPAAVYDAISFYDDHQDEIDHFSAENMPDAPAERYGFTIAHDGRLRFRGR